MKCNRFCKLNECSGSMSYTLFCVQKKIPASSSHAIASDLLVPSTLIFDLQTSPSPLDNSKMPKAKLPRPGILAGLILLFLYVVYILNNSNNNPTLPKTTPETNFHLQLSHKSKTTHVKFILKKAEAAYQSHVTRRKAIVGKNPNLTNPWPTSGNLIYFYEYFPPAFSCPHTTQRIGRIGDGGKFVCGFELFETHEEESERCILYSFGVKDESSFEAEFLQRTSCEIYGFDASVNKMGPQIVSPNPRVHFSKQFIGATDDEKAKTKTLGTIMRENGHKWIDVVKMDIEHKEFPVLHQILDEFQAVGLPFGQLQVEIHAVANGVGTFADVYKLWERLEDAGLRPFMNEINHYPCVVQRDNPWMMEYSFINVEVDNKLLD